MQRMTLILIVFLLASLSSADVLIFVDGSRMEVKSYEVKGQLVLFSTTDGKLRSVSRSYVNLEVTERVNRVPQEGTISQEPQVPPEPVIEAVQEPTPAVPAEPLVEPPVEEEPEIPAAPAAEEPAEPEVEPPLEEEPEMPDVPAPEEPAETMMEAAAEPAPEIAEEMSSEPTEPTAPDPTEQPSPEPEDSAPAVSPSEPLVPPPVWVNEELKVSLVVPSSSWKMWEELASFDVALRLENSSTGGRASLALVRERMRNYKGFQKAIQRLESAAATAAGYQSLGSGLISLPPYTVYELRFQKTVQDSLYFNQLVIFYSRDLAYVLNMNCPQENQEINESDFGALIRGVVLKKTRDDLTAKGAPKS